jgi:hypothetical protein
MELTSIAPFSRIKLECLSTDELIGLAEDIGIDIPVGLERIFIIEELLENSEAGGDEGKDDLQNNPSYSEPVALPKQYNISFIDVIIRDPLWAFVYWEIKGHDREIHENAGNFKGYCLRVIPLNEGESIPKSKENSFTVSIGAEDSARYLGFAEHSPQAAGRYIIKLGAIRGDAEWQIAVSQPFNLPRLIENDGICALDKNPLVRLSGATDFVTTKSVDRQFRTKRQ